MAASANTIIQVKDLKKHYNRGTIKALDGVTVDIYKGDVMVVIGPSGSGKSTFLRSTPVIVQIFIIYYGVFSVIELPSFTFWGFIKFNRFFPGIVALGMNSGAYLCEIIRSGMQSIDGGQNEAARSLGLSSFQTLLYIIMPQAIRNILPAIANEFVVIIKESAITYTIGMQDIMSAVNAVKGSTFILVEPLLVATAIYFCLCFPTSKLIAYVERRMSRGSKR